MVEGGAREREEGKRDERAGRRRQVEGSMGGMERRQQRMETSRTIGMASVYVNMLLYLSSMLTWYKSPITTG